MDVSHSGVVVEGGKIVTGDDLDVWERRLERQVKADTSVKETDREVIIQARRGQGRFKQRVMLIEPRCRIPVLRIRSTSWPVIATLARLLK